MPTTPPTKRRKIPLKSVLQGDRIQHKDSNVKLEKYSNSAKGKKKATSEDVEKQSSTVSTTYKSFKIVVGTYEKLLYGIEATFLEDDDQISSKPQLVLKPIFIFPAHAGCVKAVAASPLGGKWLATGSADEIIKVWDLRRQKEIGGLMHHEGSITYLTFASRTHLLSASEDGTLCLFRARDWVVLRTLKGHKGRVNCVAVHPSGKAALSVGQDRTLRMWDLMRGKGAASTKLGKEGEVIVWSSSGTHFALQSGSTIDIYNTKMTLLYTITHCSRVQDIKIFFPEGQGDIELLMVAAEDKKVTVYHLPKTGETEAQVVAYLVGHTNRVKAIGLLTVAIPPYENSKTATYSTTISSDGFIRIFDLDILKTTHLTSRNELPLTIEPVTYYDTKGSRLTCLTMADGESLSGDLLSIGKKRKHNEDYSDDERDEPGGDEEANEWPSPDPSNDNKCKSNSSDEEKLH